MAMGEDTAGGTRRRWLIGCGCVLAAGALLLAVGIGLLAWGLSSAFDHEPMAVSMDMGDPAALMTASQKIQTAAMAGMLDEAPGGAAAAGGREALLLELTADEVNALLLTGLGLHQGMALAEDGDSADRLACRFEDGVFRFRLSRRIEASTPFGNWVNLEAGVVPGIRDGRMVLGIAHCRLGRLPIPVGRIERRLAEREIPEFERSVRGQLVLRLVERLEVRPDGLLVHYRPQAVAEAMMSTAPMLNLLGGMEGGE